MKPRDLLLLQTPDDQVKVSVFFQNGSFWFTQKAMAALFGVDRTVINKQPEKFSLPVNWKKAKYVQNLHILPKMVKLQNQFLSL
jgi:hypothetical protein